MKKAIDETPNIYLSECFDIYWRLQNPEIPFYFAFSALPYWYKNLVDEFNSTFKNIKIKIEKEKELLLIDEFSEYWNESVIRPFIPFFYLRPLPFQNRWGVYKILRAKTAVFSLSFNKKYKEDVVKYLRYFIHHFLRILSLCEEVIPVDFNCPDSNLIDTIIDISNQKDNGRNLSEYPITKEEFLLMDDIKLMNERFLNRSRLIDDTFKQTEISLTIANRYAHVFLPGKRVRIKYNPINEIFLVTDARRDRTCVSLRNINTNEDIKNFIYIKNLELVEE